MSNEELSQHAPALLELLTDKLKREQDRQRFQEGYGFNRETIESIAQRIVRDNLGEKEVKAIAKALTTLNPVATTSRLSRLRRELRKLNAPKKIISATLDEKTTCASNKI
ncbi:hypothetical protein RclHR1_18660008 [Rhizophagus clarus]|uniref:Uncharacterized protein n=1 Tax=Rhizophagus clarus TaxID=94130 RepID=A0A2Z6RFW5_9GLOM|nr:hypothetical protein RclHR1_18660008 [Rhizophagus clarus]